MEKKTNPTIVVDEGVSAAQFARFEAFARRNDIPTSDCLFIQETHPGMPDSQIMHHYLDGTTILVTIDRPFHNRALRKGLRSYYLDEETITAKPLPGIRPKPDIVPTKDDQILKESYQPPTLDLRPLLLPAAATRLKTLRTKRRRIRNHFRGQDHLEHVAVTVSWRTLGSGTLIGIRVRISSNVGLKALDASESYVVETVVPERRDLVAVSHALVLLIQLMLQPVKTLVYYDSHTMDHPLVQEGEETEDRYRTFFNTLLDSFDQVEFIPAAKGKYVEKLRRKLDQLSRDDRANEIIPGDIEEMIEKVEHRSEPYAVE
jgi:hypothetical protein